MSGAGKSELALAFALALANGNAILGKTAPLAGDVLYLTLEENARWMQNRTYKLLQGRPAPSSFAWAEHWNPLRTGGLADIEEWLEEHSTAHCVVIDTLEQTEMNGEQASLFTTDEYSHMLPLKVIADTYHIALVLLHHLNKYEVNDLNDRNGGRSTSDLFNMVDCSMFLTREPGQTDAMLHISGQSMEDQQLALCFEPASAQWKLKGVLQ